MVAEFYNRRGTYCDRADRIITCSAASARSPQSRREAVSIQVALRTGAPDGSRSSRASGPSGEAAPPRPPAGFSGAG